MPQWKPMSEQEPHAMHWGDKAIPVVDTPSDLMKLQVKAWSSLY